MTWRRWSVLGVLVLAPQFGSCGPTKTQPAPAPVPRSSADCVQACGHLRELQCREAEPTPEGAPCEQWCDHFGDHRPAPLTYGIKIDCLVGITDCTQTDKCGR